MTRAHRALATAAVAAVALVVVAPLPSAAVAAPGPSCQVDPQCDEFRPVFYQDFVPDAPGVRGIFRINPDGSGRTEVIRDASFPSVDRARTRIAFLRNGEIWIAAADGSDQQRVTDRAEGVVSDVTLSPEGDHVAYTAGASDTIVVRNLTGSDRCVGVVDENGGPLHGRWPRWSPDGIHLAFVLSAPEPGIAIARCDGRNRREIVRGASTGAYIDWSADGRRVVFEGAEGMSWVDVQAPGQIHVIPNTAPIADAASWSPDSRRLVISDKTSATRGLWTVGVDGTGLMKIAEIVDHSGRPDWGYPVGPVVALP